MNELDKLIIELSKLNNKVDFKKEEARIINNEHENAIRERNCLADKINLLKRRLV